MCALVRRSHVVIVASLLLRQGVEHKVDLILDGHVITSLVELGDWHLQRHLKLLHEGAS